MDKGHATEGKGGSKYSPQCARLRYVLSLLARLVSKQEGHLLGNASPGFTSMAATDLQKADSDAIEGDGGSGL